MLVYTTLEDSLETVTAPQMPPAVDDEGQSIDWADRYAQDVAALTGWDRVHSWGICGWACGNRRLQLYTRTVVRSDGPVYGLGEFDHGYTDTRWYRTPAARDEAITAWNFYLWSSGAVRGPEDLPPSIELLTDAHRTPYVRHRALAAAS